MSDFALTVPAKTINLSSEDIASFRRVLTSLDEPDNRTGLTEPHEASLRAIALAMLEIRRARAAFLNPAMLGEPAYEMLLRLYVCDGRGDPLTPARLAELGGIPHSSALRWIEYLASKDLVTRDRHPNDRRATVIGLAAKGKEALDALFRMIHDAGLWQPANSPQLSPAP